MFDININTLLEDMPNIFKFIYKNICFLDFEESPPYEYFITLLEKEKFKMKANKKASEEYKFAWTEKIIKILDKNNKSLDLKNEIKEMFHNINITDLKEYFKNFEKEVI